MIAPGTRLGPYTITASIGAGGMGEVYQATDTRLKRDVAIKILPESFATDADRLARFQREAEVLASLNHPNIAAIYGIEESDGKRGLVMELVEGPTLAARIAQGPIRVDDALSIAKQVAEALEAAHERGIIHRDLKPANIKVRPDGTVKVLDFGLAKALEPASTVGLDATASPTVTSPAMMTGVGVLLGTAAYMSPEQAKGHPADRRSDVWAFGAVLFEMVTGRRAFAGDEVSEVLASVLAREPDWSLLPPGLSPTLATYIKRCLKKDPKQRIGDVQSIRLALEGAFETGQEARFTTSAAVVRGPVGWRGAMLWGLAGVLAGVLLLWALVRPDSAPSEAVTRLSLSLVANEAFTNTTRRVVALSPDGTHVAYTANTGLLVRPLDQLRPTRIPGTEGAQEPFFSPDGQWIGFWAGGQLKRVSVGGGAPVTLGRVAPPWGAWWGADGTILLGLGPEGILHMPGTGRTPEILIAVDGQMAHGPQMLPGGMWVLFTLRADVASSWDEAQIVMQSLATGERTVLIEGGRDARYLPTGHLVFARVGELLAVRFDLAARRVTGAPVKVIEDVAATGANNAGAHFSVAGNGSLAYVPAGAIALMSDPRTLVWVDRQGRETPVSVPARGYVYPRFSPDGTRLALDVRDGPADVWIWDVASETPTRLTFDPRQDRHPAWSPDGRRIAFSSQRDGSLGNLFWQAADGTGDAERLAEGKYAMFPTSFSADGSQILINLATGGTSGGQFDNDDIAVVSEGRVTPLLATMFGERNGEVSPDGRWLAYESDESGREEIYVRPFPDVQGGRWQVSTGGGTRPLWARSGKELFYLVPPGRVMSVPIRSEASFSAGNAQVVLDGPYIVPNSSRTYDVSPNGERFLMIKESGSSPVPPQIIIVQNWFQELERLVPTR